MAPRTLTEPYIKSVQQIGFVRNTSTVGAGGFGATTFRSVEHARQMIAQYGETNPWIRVCIFRRVSTQSSLNVLIGPDEVSAAMKRYREYEIGGAARVLGVDVARMNRMTLVNVAAFRRREGLRIWSAAQVHYAFWHEDRVLARGLRALST